MTKHSGATIPVSPETKAALEPLKQEAENADTWDEFQRQLAEDELAVSWEDIETYETEERIERTRATVVAVFEAVDELGLTEDVLDIVKTLSQQDMLAKNQEIIDHLLEKAKNGESLNDVDRLLAGIVRETEAEREMKQSPAAEIAQGLFAETDTTTAERKTTERHETARSATFTENEQPASEDEEAPLDGVDFSLETSDEDL